MIVAQEMKRSIGSWGPIDGLAGGMIIGLPPVFNFGKPELVRKIVPQVISGQKRICLAISDSYAGSDVANTTCTATLVRNDLFYLFFF